MVIIGGDSFTAPYGGKCWFEHLNYGKRVLNKAWHGAGNFYIADSIKRTVQANHKIIKKVIILWSEFYRYDMLVKKPIDQFSRRVPEGYWQFCSPNRGYKKWKLYFEPVYRDLTFEKVIELSKAQVFDTHTMLDKYQVDYNFGFVYEDDLNTTFVDHPRFIPITFRTFVKENKLEGDDGYHPSAEGHQAYAEAIRPFL